MRPAVPKAVTVAFVGALLALVGLAWDVSIHFSFPALAGHETPLDPLSPAHDLFAGGLLVAAGGGAAALGRLRIWAFMAVLASIAALAAVVVTGPAQPVGTGDQQAKADALWKATAQSVVRYRSVAAAESDGYLAYNPSGGTLVHYVNPNYMGDGRVLDPLHVESFLYVNTWHGPVLAAAMYSLEDPNRVPPDVAGQLTPWHRHDDLCFTPTGEVVGSAPRCPYGSATYFTPWMLHVWLVPNRSGRFAADLDPWSELMLVTGAVAPQY